jgi:hypothetical protein
VQSKRSYFDVNTPQDPLDWWDFELWYALRRSANASRDQVCGDNEVGEFDKQKQFGHHPKIWDYGGQQIR